MNQPKNRWQPNAIYELQEKPVKPSYEELLKQRDELLKAAKGVLPENQDCVFEAEGTTSLYAINKLREAIEKTRDVENAN
jgi:hypothetical protein